MGLIYTAQFNGVAVTAQQDLFELVAPSTGPILIHQIIISQLTEVGDAQEENLLLLLKRGATTSGSGGSTPTPVPVDAGTAGTVVEANNTTKASAGTIVTLHAEHWNVRSPFVLLPTPELRPNLHASVRMTLELATTPADSITMAGVVYFEEL